MKLLMVSSAPKVLITGMSATGKSTVLEQLSQMGYRTLDMDDRGNSYRDSAGNQLWNETAVERAMIDAKDEPFFIGGCAENQTKFYSSLTDIVIFSAPREVILRRLATRTNNPYGKSGDERDEILRNLEKVEPLLRRRASFEIDTSIDLADVVNQLLDRICLIKR